MLSSAKISACGRWQFSKSLSERGESLSISSQKMRYRLPKIGFPLNIE